MLYVATLNFVSNLFVNGPAQSNVWRVDPNGARYVSINSSSPTPGWGAIVRVAA